MTQCFACEHCRQDQQSSPNDSLPHDLTYGAALILYCKPYNLLECTIVPRPGATCSSTIESKVATSCC